MSAPSRAKLVFATKQRAASEALIHAVETMDAADLETAKRLGEAALVAAPDDLYEVVPMALLTAVFELQSRKHG